VSATIVGPIPNFSVPIAVFVAVGRRTSGPTLQIIRPDFDGEKSALSTKSPNPFSRVSSGPGCDMTGMITRRITLVLELTANGMTG
jgi:hypothetical protein